MSGCRNKIKVDLMKVMEVWAERKLTWTVIKCNISRVTGGKLELANNKAWVLVGGGKRALMPLILFSLCLPFGLLEAGITQLKLSVGCMTTPLYSHMLSAKQDWLSFWPGPNHFCQVWGPRVFGTEMSESCKCISNYCLAHQQIPSCY